VRRKVLKARYHPMQNLSIHRILIPSAMHSQAQHIWSNQGRTQNVRLQRECTHNLASDEWVSLWSMWDVLEVCQIRKVNTGQQDEKVLQCRTVRTAIIRVFASATTQQIIYNKSALYAFNELPYSSSLYKISIDFFFDPQQ
jgi:hypothetical protein